MTTRLTSLVVVLAALGCGSGADGKDGAPGEAGDAGADGEDGSPGSDGEEGKPGADGADGTDGEAGADGVDGADGETGADGADGTDGADGADAYDTLIASEYVFEDMYGCDQGYEIISFGVDDGTDGIADDGVLQDGEVRTVSTVCLPPDVDDDGVLNLEDNCPEDANPDQADLDYDGIGTVCETEEEEPLAGPSGSLYLATRGTTSASSQLYWMEDEAGSPEYVGEIGYALTTIKINPADGLLYGMERSYAADGYARMILIDQFTGEGTPASESIYHVGGSAWSEGGPYSSMAFLTDGTPVGWSEGGDFFVRMDLEAATATVTGSSLSSARHGMCVSNEDMVYFTNMGPMYVFSAETGYIGDAATVDFDTDLKGGDCNRDSGIMYTVNKDDPGKLYVTTSLWGDSPSVDMVYDLPDTPYNEFHSVALVP